LQRKALPAEDESWEEILPRIARMARMDVALRMTISYPCYQ